MTLTQYGIQKDEISDLIVYIGELPPVEIYDKMLDKYGAHIQKVFKLTSESLDAFFFDKPSPLNPNIFSTVLIKNVQMLTHRHLTWALTIFQAESYLQTEAKKYSFPLPQKRSDLLKILWLEECIFDFYPLTLECYEELSGWQMEEIRLYGQKYDQELISAGLYEKKCLEWEDWMGKLVTDCSFAELLRMIPWTIFCGRVFYKYREQLPGFEAWQDAMGFTKKISSRGKTAIINKEVKSYPKRGKGRKPS